MITVFGSINIDLVTRVSRIPRPGETVLGPSYDVIPGGKGANQALAAARAGADVRMIGAGGPDGFASLALELLRDGGVDCAGVVAVDQPTGAAFITLDAAGENCIVVASGANALVSAAMLQSVAWGEHDTLLMQREAPENEIIAAAKLAKTAGARVVLNAAPSAGFSAATLAGVDVLIVNEHEVRDVGAALGFPETSGDDIARRLSAERGVMTIVTLGGEGAIGWSDGERMVVAAPRVEIIDTTSAGDAFCGAFAAALDRGADWRAAMAQGVAAGSLACGKAGAQPSLPYRADIERLAATLG